MAAVDVVPRRASSGEGQPSRIEPKRAAYIRIPLFDLSEQAKSLCPRPAAATIEDLERILEKSVARRKGGSFKDYIEQRDEATIQELEKRAALCRRMNIVRCRTYGLPLFREGEHPREYYIVLHGNFQCIGRVYNGNSIPMEWTSEVRPGQDFYYEMGIGSSFGCISTAVPLLSKPSVSTAISDETSRLLNRFPIASKLPRVKVCTLLSIDLEDMLSHIEPDMLHLNQISSRISEMPIFAACSPRDFQAISPLFHMLHPVQGEIIFEQGSVLDRFYFVSAGSVELMLTKSSDKSCVISAPGMFGEESVICPSGEHAHATFRAICCSDQTELYWALGSSVRERLHEEHIRFLEHLHQTSLDDCNLMKEKIVNREHRLRNNHSVLNHSSLSIDTSSADDVGHNTAPEAAETLHVMQSDRAFYKRFAPSDDSDAAKFKRFLRGASPFFQSNERRSSQLPYSPSDFKDEDEEDFDRVKSIPERASSVDLIRHNRKMHNTEQSKSAQSIDFVRGGPPKEKALYFGHASEMRSSKRGELKAEEEWTALFSKPYHGTFSISNAPKAIQRSRKEREGKFLPSNAIPLLLETKNISYRTEMILSKNDYIPNRANFELPPQVVNSFLGLYMPFNNKYIAHARKMAIRREEIEYNRLRRK